MGFGSQRVDLSTINFTPGLLRCVPKHVARKYRALPIFETSDSLGIAIAGPPDLDMIDSLSHVLKRPLEFRAADEQQLVTFLGQHYGIEEGGQR